MVEAWVGRIGACGCYDVCYVLDVSSPLLDGLFASSDGKLYPLFSKGRVQFEDGRGVGLVDNGMINAAYRSTCLDAGEAIDGEDLFKPDKLRIIMIYAKET